mmetsp:Transcript_14832/g.37676  ORF Transcript_14832/g.37676 Transcript_14832/m.37676 type:complete len:316 (-) Transcript_14832:101-1048(-)
MRCSAAARSRPALSSASSASSRCSVPPAEAASPKPSPPGSPSLACGSHHIPLPCPPGAASLLHGSPRSCTSSTPTARSHLVTAGGIWTSCFCEAPRRLLFLTSTTVCIISSARLLNVPALAFSAMRPARRTTKAFISSGSSPRSFKPQELSIVLITETSPSSSSSARSFSKPYRVGACRRPQEKKCAKRRARLWHARLSSRSSAARSAWAARSRKVAASSCDRTDAARPATHEAATAVNCSVARGPSTTACRMLSTAASRTTRRLVPLYSATTSPTMAWMLASARRLSSPRTRRVMRSSSLDAPAVARWRAAGGT